MLVDVAHACKHLFAGAGTAVANAYVDGGNAIPQPSQRVGFLAKVAIPHKEVAVVDVRHGSLCEEKAVKGYVPSCRTAHKVETPSRLHLTGAAVLLLATG